MRTKPGDIIRGCTAGGRIDPDLWVVDYINGGRAHVTIKRRSRWHFPWKNFFRSWIIVEPKKQ